MTQSISVTATVSTSQGDLAEFLAVLPECMGADVEFATCAPAHTSELTCQDELTCADVVEVAELIRIDFASVPFTVEDLHLGMLMELEHERPHAPIDIIDEGLLEIGRTAVSHLHERPDYYRRLTQAHAPGDPPLPEYQYADVGTD
ncbi:MAG: DUF5661 family protein [Chloroflexota bacterium]